MHDQISDPSPAPSEAPRSALSTWDGEGGAGPLGSQEEADSNAAQRTAMRTTQAELVHLRIRVTALENLMITLLSRASAQERAERAARSPHP